MSRVAPQILSIVDPFEGVLLDAYGVFWNGGKRGPLPGALETMKELRNLGKVVGVLSNSTQRASKEVEKFASFGLKEGEHFHFIITSGEVAQELFATPGGLPFNTKNKKYALFGEAHPKYASHHSLFAGSLYQETSLLEEADFIYLSIPHMNGEDQINPKVFQNQIETVVKSGLPMVCANPDKFAHEGDPPRAVVRQGSIAALYEQLGGKVFYMGKPFQDGYKKAMFAFSHLGIEDPANVLMVGDTPETDIRGANRFGMSSCLLVNTGIMGDRVHSLGLETAISEIQETDRPQFYAKKL